MGLMGGGFNDYRCHCWSIQLVSLLLFRAIRSWSSYRLVRYIFSSQLEKAIRWIAKIFYIDVCQRSVTIILSRFWCCLYQFEYFLAGEFAQTVQLKNNFAYFFFSFCNFFLTLNLSLIWSVWIFRRNLIKFIQKKNFFVNRTSEF